MRQVEYETIGILNPPKALEPRLLEDQTMEMMIMKMKRIMTGGKVGMIGLLQINEGGT